MSRRRAGPRPFPIRSSGRRALTAGLRWVPPPPPPLFVSLHAPRARASTTPRGRPSDHLWRAPHIAICQLPSARLTLRAPHVPVPGTPSNTFNARPPPPPSPSSFSISRSHPRGVQRHPSPSTPRSQNPSIIIISHTARVSRTQPQQMGTFNEASPLLMMPLPSPPAALPFTRTSGATLRRPASDERVLESSTTFIVRCAFYRTSHQASATALSARASPRSSTASAALVPSITRTARLWQQRECDRSPDGRTGRRTDGELDRVRTRWRLEPPRGAAT